MKKIEVHLYDEKVLQMSHIQGTNAKSNIQNQPRSPCREPLVAPMGDKSQNLFLEAPLMTSLFRVQKPMPFNDTFTDICLHTTRIW